jgi:hypothetical protein
MPSNVWSAGYGPADRILEPGSWDGFIFNGAYGPPPDYAIVSAPPSVSPVPEPSAMVLVFFTVAGLALIGRRRLIEVQPPGCAR